MFSWRAQRRLPCSSLQAGCSSVARGSGASQVTSEAGKLSRRAQHSLAEVADSLQTQGISVRIVGDSNTVFGSVAEDSRTCGSGILFLALPGETVDGSDFIGAALAAGSPAALCSESAAAKHDGACLIVVDDVTRAAGHVAALSFGGAVDELTLVGITGTNGKTSCTYLLESVWSAAGTAAGVIGTVAARWPGTERTAAMTTPALVDLHSTLAEMVEAGCAVAALEVSSHALAQHRIAGCRFAVGVFTNLTRDHLDYHGDERSYLAAKALLFERYVDAEGVCIVNADDASASAMKAAAGERRTLTFSTAAAANADVVVVVKNAALDGMNLRITVDGKSFELRTRLLGAPNVSNIAAVVATAIALGVDRDAIIAGLTAARPVPGRLERVGESSPAVLVDYAHTPDALERTLETVREMVVGGRLISVFGCGGDRDRGKRPMMGRASGRIADVSILTSDNPRSEPPKTIVSEIAVGTAEHATETSVVDLGSATGAYAVEIDRERAIALALEIASPNDVVLIAGKGHEDYQETGGVRRHFDDREVVRTLQARREG